MLRISKILWPCCALALAGILALDPMVARAQRGGAGGTAVAASAGPFGALRWRNIGPERGGRSIAVAGSASRPLEYYFGATGGGLWKSVDGGTTWKPVTDGQITTPSVGSVAAAGSNPDVAYHRTGEP